MKVISSTPQTLVIADRPLVIVGFLWVIGAAMIWAAVTGDIYDSRYPAWVGQLLGLSIGAGTMGIAWFFFPFQHFSFDRQSGQFSHRAMRPLSTQEDKISLPDIVRARLEKNWGESTWVERVVLERKDATMYPLEKGFVGVPRQPIVDAINDWLDM